MYTETAQRKIYKMIEAQERLAREMRITANEIFLQHAKYQKSELEKKCPDLRK